MTFRARYRFILLSPLQIEKGTALEITLPDLPLVAIELGAEAHPVGHWAIAKMDGFENEEEARKAGQRLGAALLVAGAVTRLGIDIGFSQSTLQLHSDIHKAVRGQTGRELRFETHGLMVYEKDTVQIVGMDARGTALIGPEAFKERLSNWIEPSSVRDQRLWHRNEGMI